MLWDTLGLASPKAIVVIEDCSECNSVLKAVLPEFQKEIDYLKKEGCDTPILCACTPHGGEWDGPCIPCKKSKGKVVLSCSDVKNKADARRVLKHELVHALQGCTGKTGNTCEWRMCMEIQAAYTADCAKNADDPVKRKACVKDAAEYSTHSAKSFGKNAPCKTKEEFEKVFEEMYEKCAKVPTSWQ
jgi:hypothetical protein